MMLYATCGLPGCGKTTRARAWVAEDRASRARVNRDDFRDMLSGGWLGTVAQEDQVTAAAHAAVEALLRAGYDVVCDDTNLRSEHLDALREIAGRCRAGFEVWDLTGVPLQVCIERDERRGVEGGRCVGADTIRAMHDGYQRRTALQVAR
jgi:predicted kinase